MSTASMRVNARHLSPRSAPVEAAPMEATPVESTTARSAPSARLAELRPGMSAQVIDIDPSIDPRTARRLSDLGFAPGGEVTVLRKAPLGDPVVFQVADYEVALRRAQAVGVRVHRTA